jgi:hypothetical protein
MALRVNGPGYKFNFPDYELREKVMSGAPCLRLEGSSRPSPFLPVTLFPPLPAGGSNLKFRCRSNQFEISSFAWMMQFCMLVFVRSGLKFVDLAWCVAQ